MRQGDINMPLDKFNDEKTLLNKIRNTYFDYPHSIFFLTHNKNEPTILKQLLKRKYITSWKDSSGKDAPPPDFYSKKFKLMADIMQVNDSERSKKKNIQRAADTESYNSLIQSGILDKFPNIEQIEIINTCPEITTNHHHKYSWYVKSFNRIVKNHKDSIALYKKNHPGYDIIFIIYDESEPYSQLPSCLVNLSNIQVGDELLGELHYPFLDKNIMDVFVDSDIDYVVWYMNNKTIQCVDTNGNYQQKQLPKIVVFKPSELHTVQFQEYFSCRMVSVNL